MIKFKKYIYLCLLVVVISSCRNPEIDLGNGIIVKIELFKKKNGKLPDQLSDLGIKETEQGPIYYEKRDSINYTVSFGTSMGESMIYYSDSKKWEELYREMK
jgi:hypothetical protein